VRREPHQRIAFVTADTAEPELNADHIPISKRHIYLDKANAYLGNTYP
jgi:hypothetical protein